MSENRLRQKSILVRLTDDEYAQIQIKAEAAEQSIPSYLRTLGLKQKINYPLIKKEDAAEISRQIRMIGNNLNQITKLAHQGSVKVIHAEDAQKELERVWQLLSSLQRNRPTS